MVMKPIDLSGVNGTDLVTLRSFTATFWKVYGSCSSNQQEVFYALDGLYFETFGEHRFPSFDAYRMAVRRKRKK